MYFQLSACICLVGFNRNDIPYFLPILKFVENIWKDILYMIESWPVSVSLIFMSYHDSVAMYIQTPNWVTNKERYHHVSGLKIEKVRLINLPLTWSNSTRSGCRAVINDMHLNSLHVNLAIFDSRMVSFFTLHSYFTIVTLATVEE